MNAVCKKLFVLVVFVLLPRLLFAQAAITGTVKDTSGAVLPGVTVEAASPVLIEKVRSAVTDSAGLYRIVDLRPGTYTLTFTLPGFTTVKREGLELAGSVTLTIPAEMRVGDAAGNRHGHRRDAGRRRPERADARRCSARTSSRRCRRRAPTARC